MTFTRPQLRQFLYKEIGVDDLGFSSTATAVTTTGITDEVRFGATNENVNRYAFGQIYRPKQTVPANQLKEAGAVSTSTLLHVSNTNYTDDLSDLYYEWLRKEILPEEINEAIRKALRRIYFETYAPITPWVDGDMSASNLDAWIAVNATRAKSQAAAQNLDGFQSLVVTNSGAQGYAAPASPLAVMTNETYYLAANAILLQGTTARFRVYDATHNRELVPSTGAPYVQSGRAVHLHGLYTVPAGCSQLTCLLQCDEANGIVAWTDLPGHELQARKLPLPTWMDAGFKLLAVLEAEHGTAPLSPNVEAWQTRSFRPWYRPQDYDTQILSVSANPQSLQVNREDEQLPAEDLWLHGWRAFSDQATLEDETSVTNAPEDLVKAAVLAEASALLARVTPDARWSTLQQQAEAWLQAQFQARRPEMQPRLATSSYVVGGRPSGRFSQDGRGGNW